MKQFGHVVDSGRNWWKEQPDWSLIAGKRYARLLIVGRCIKRDIVYESQERIHRIVKRERD